MKLSNARFRTTLAASLLALSCTAFGGSPQAQAAYTPPSWQSNAVIYCVFPRIFSSGKNLAGVTAQITRLKNLGVNVLWLMPFQPVGQSGTYAGASRPTYGSPYDTSNLEGIDPYQGSSSDLTSLITAAHNAGMHVILDVALNQTSWDNPLIVNDPQYYYHSDGNVNNSNSIENAFGSDTDIAWVDILNNTYGAQTYMTGVCQYWLKNYAFDGFRFDTADSTDSSSRSFPQSYAESLYNTLNPNNTLMWLGEENNTALADAPYTLDYDWNISFNNYASGGTLQATAMNGNGVPNLENGFNALGPGGNGWPSTFQHMLMLQDWDTDMDYTTCGGFPQILPAAAFNLTMPGVPLIYNGEEVGNDQGQNAPFNYTLIDWSSPNASKFTTFYNTMIHNRLNIPALQQNAYTFEGNGNNSASVCTIDRGTPGSSDCYVELNFSGSAISGSCTVPAGNGWIDISPSVSPGGTSHINPSTGTFSLAPYDYAVFQRATTTGTLTGALTKITATTAYNLTSLGATDWDAWGYNTSGGVDRDTNGGSKISTLYTYNGGSLNAFTAGTLNFNWTNGTPDASVSSDTKGYYNNGGNGDGFSFTVPADTTTRNVTVYVGGYASGGTLTAYLSDGSAPQYASTALSNTSNSYFGSYTLTYKAVSAGQKLTVNWVQNTSTSGSNVTLYAATLH